MGKFRGQFLRFGNFEEFSSGLKFRDSFFSPGRDLELIKVLDELFVYFV